MSRLAEQLGGRTELDELAGVHDREPVGEVAHQRQVVGDEQDREPELALELLHPLQQGPLRHHVERGRRLVHDHQVGTEDQRHGDHRALPHAAGQLVRVAGEVDRVDTHQPQHLGRPRPHGLAGHVLVRGHRVVKLGLDAQHRVQRVHRRLHDDGVVAPPDVAELVLGQVDHVDAVELDGARTRWPPAG